MEIYRYSNNFWLCVALSPKVVVAVDVVDAAVDVRQRTNFVINLNPFITTYAEHQAGQLKSHE